MFNEYKEVISIKELCEILGISRNTAYDLLQSNEIQGFRVGHVWKIQKDSVEKFILSQQNKTHNLKE